MNEHSVGIYSLNVRGIGNSFKRKQVFLWLKNHPGCIYFCKKRIVLRLMKLERFSGLVVGGFSGWYVLAVRVCG